MRALIPPLSLPLALALSAPLSHRASAHATPLPPISDAQRQGEVTVRVGEAPDGGAEQMTAEGLVKAPLDAVWGVILDCGDYKNTMPSIKESAVLSRAPSGDKMRCEVVADLPWPLGDLRSVVDVTLSEPAPGERLRAWTLVEGDYARNEGEWRLWAVDEGKHTFLRYVIRVEPHTKIPDFIRKKAQKSKLPELFDALRAKLKVGR